MGCQAVKVSVVQHILPPLSPCAHHPRDLSICHEIISRQPNHPVFVSLISMALLLQVGDDTQMGVLYLFVKLKEYSNGIRED